ncbi:Triosephosphate isomerase [Candidatus Fokinia cryptica]|uniref:Triosephosphate isomerase n=2 Tax=Candidatus Fokinia crypta TaxID=1920990 RepID=A0ABZ0UR74_9RICK|nr:Triosephosphate isomerase [Candidatus Fokinia cryptica]
MNGSLSFVHQISSFVEEWKEIKDIALSQSSVHIKIVICPPYLYIPSLHDIIASLNLDIIYLGAQNCSEHESGSYTGEISTEILKEFGCSYVILGHQERKKIYENNDIIMKKIEIAKKYDIAPIQCINDHDIQNKVALSGDIIAYEPTKYIGAAECESIDKISSTIQLIKSTYITQEYGKKVVYGGAVNSDNIRPLYQITSLDGVLVGRSSLNYKEFTKLLYGIIRA